MNNYLNNPQHCIQAKNIYFVEIKFRLFWTIGHYIHVLVVGLRFPVPSLILSWVSTGGIIADKIVIVMIV